MSKQKPPAAESEGLLARWSARKARVREEDRALQEQAEDAVSQALQEGEPAEAAARELDARAEVPPAAEAELTDADMPPVESLDERSDLSMFFSSKVSAELRRRALRKVFVSAAFNRVDGLDDYAEDFTAFAPLGDVLTSDLKHQMEMARKRLAADEQQLEPIEGESPIEDVATDNEVLDEGLTEAGTVGEDQEQRQVDVRHREGDSKA